MQRADRRTWAGRSAASIALASALAAGLGGCGPTVLPAADYAETVDQDPSAEGSSWASWMPGEKLILTVQRRGCEATLGSSFDDLEQGGKPLTAELAAGTTALLEVEEASVVTEAEGEPGWIALHLRDDHGTERWLRVRSGAPRRCLWRATADARELAQEPAQQVVFAPWRPECTRIEATGTAPGAALIESEAGTPMQTSGMVFAPADPTAQQGSFAPWMTLNRGTLAVRSDTYRTCFLPQAKAASHETADAASLLHIDPARCVSSQEEGGTHLLCATTVGVWEGHLDDSRVSLELRRRTLGTLHLLGSKPVKSGRWAHAVISVSTGKPADQRTQTLYDAVEQAVAERLNAAEGAVRVSTPDDPALTYQVLLEITDVRIGPLERTVVTESTQYKSGERDVPNPAKATARERVRQAREKVQQAETDYQNARQTWAAAVAAAQEAKNVCLNSCAGYTDATARSNCETGCNIGGGVGDVMGALTEPTDNDVVAARNELAQAEQTEQSTPETIREDIMSPWQYSKEVFSRAVAASLRVTMAPRDGQPSTETLPLTHRWEDFEVTADPAHNVQGHQPDRDPIEREDALIPFVANLAGKRAAKYVEVALARASLEELRRKFAATGQQSKPGFEDVNAMAFDVAGARLLKVAQQGTSQAAGGGAPVMLPSAAVRIGEHECLLAVAVAEGASESIELTARQGSYGDLRRKPFAFVEICAPELPRAEHFVDDLAVTSEQSVKVRWALYLTRATQPASGPTAPPPPS